MGCGRNGSGAPASPAEPVAARGSVAVGPQRSTDVLEQPVHEPHVVRGEQQDGVDLARLDQVVDIGARDRRRSEEHTSELQSLMRNSYAVFCLKKKKQQIIEHASKD